MSVTGRSYRIRGLDRDEEIAALKQVIGPLLGNQDTLSFSMSAY